MQLEEPFYINRCIQQIEEKQLWGLSKHWKNKEYQKLSEQVTHVSKICISPITLKRLFGKVQTSRDYNPQIETKNALAIYLGYYDWENFKQKNPIMVSDADTVPILKTTKKPAIKIDNQEHYTEPLHANLKQRPILILKKIWVFIFVAVIGIAITIYLLINTTKQPLQVGIATLATDTTQAMVPFTPVFKYDVSKVRSDSVFIEYGDGVKELLPKDQHSIAYTYLIPNFYQVKISVKDAVLAQKNVHAKSDGWHAEIFYNDGIHHNVPVSNYKMFHDKGMLYMSKKFIDSIGINKLFYWVSYRNINSFDVSGDNFIMETRFLNDDHSTEWKFCDVLIKVLGETGVHRSHFLNPGVSSHAEIWAGDVKVIGKYKDLSAFGQDMSQWHVSKLHVKNKEAKFYIDNKHIYTIKYTDKIGKLKGVIITTRGTGKIDYIKLFDHKGAQIYKDNFD